MDSVATGQRLNRLRMHYKNMLERPKRYQEDYTS